MGEKFAANPVTGTGSMSVPIALSPGRGGFGPQLSLSYDSGAGNGLFGLGWNLSLPAITRKTDKGLPRYLEDEESDVFLLAGAEDLVPLLDAVGRRRGSTPCDVYGTRYQVSRYMPRIEGLFALIERWTQASAPANTFWRTISRDNITTWYGRAPSSRISDPLEPARIFQWNVCEMHDDKGNVTLFQYTRETGLGIGGSRIEEPERPPAQRTANSVPDRIRYGNLKPYLPTYGQTGAVWPGPDDIAGQQWMFEVVFDYSPPDAVEPPSAAPAAPSKWLVRKDPFSTHRAGFEIRTYRLCRRVLMFHRFEELGITPCLVRSTDFDYAEPVQPSEPTLPGFTTLRSVSHHGYQRKASPAQGYESRQLPPVTFDYSRPKVNQTVQTIAPDQLDNLPVGTQGPGYQWIDLDGEGLSGVLAEQLGAWYYKPNLGAGTDGPMFGPMREVARQPAMAQSAGSRHQFMDLAGNGSIDVVDFSGPTPGFHERDQDEGWKRHVPFASLPNIDWQDPNLRFVDLTGDGHADALITEQDVFTWHPSLAQDGFGRAEQSRQARDEDAGPRLVFADGTQTIFLADMCGDGLTDLVRIRNGEVCYWPNLGYGRFGRKVTLGNSPRFDHVDLYDPRRIRLTDIDGSGPIDIIYLGRKGAQLYFNRSGNSLSNALLVDLPVATDNLAAVQVADLLGNGTACLVWNSHLPADARNPVRYIDLMAGDEDPAKHKKHEKPHLLIKVKNNLGGTTEIEYTPSTRFYIQDKLAGTPWVTRLPFPVHCVSRVTVSDEWRSTQFSSTYSYHHGYFDGAEREFRGFGRVEQLDVERYDKSASNNIGSPFVTQDHTLYQPPVKNITWYHTGAALDRQRILNQFAHEYFPQRFADRLPNLAQQPNAFRENPLPEPELPADLGADEWREALRACKGMVLRQEVYELDVDELTAVPTPKQTPVRIYSAATHNCHIQRLQQQGDNRHAVFLVTESEALSYQYELALPKDSSALTPDPRIAHTLNLRHDEYGNAQQTVAIGYPRIVNTLPPGLPADARRDSLMRAVQSELHIAYSETRYTEDVVLPLPATGSTRATRHHRLRLPCEVKTYEITGLAQPPLGSYYHIAELRRHALCEDGTYPPTVPPGQTAVAMTPLQYHQQPYSATPHRRIVEHARTLFFSDASDTARPTAKLAFGQHGPRGLKYEDYKLALTTGLLDAVFKQTDAAGNMDDKLAWEVQLGKTARVLLDEPTPQNPHHLKSGYILGRGVDASLTGQYWMRSGIAGFADDAHEHFFLPERYTDPFGNTTELKYDQRDLFVQSSKDALGNTSGIWVDPGTNKARFDYRVLTPIEMVDANGNHSEVAFDIRGLVVAAAIKGKKTTAGTWQGDSLDGFDFDLANPSERAVVTFCTDSRANRSQAAIWLGNASSRFVYHFGATAAGWGQHMPGACGIVRERHASQVASDPAHEHPIQIALECSDGSGAVLMKKVQAEAGPIVEGGLVVSPRWIVNGLTILNNKGKPVKQYEPTFSADFGCELPQANGVTPIMYYDAAGHVMRTELPDGTLSRVEFSPWHVKTFDANDTVLESDWYQHRINPAHAKYPEYGTAENRRAAVLAAKHANTPALTILDSLGREVIAIAHNRTPDGNGDWQEDYYLTYTKLDAEGKPLWIRDARGNLVMQYITPAKANNAPGNDLPYRADSATGQRIYSTPCYDIAGNLLFQHSMDAGDRWMLMDAAGKPMLGWDYNEFRNNLGTVIPQNRLYRTEYDALHRPTKQWLKINDDAPALIEAFEYLDTDSFKTAGVIDQAALEAEQKKNRIGQAIKHWDPSGLATVERIDLSGKPAHITRRLIKVTPSQDDLPALNWDIAQRDDLLEDKAKETFHQLTEYDALGRMTRHYNWHRDITFAANGTSSATPGSTNRVAVYVPVYNERGALKAEWLHVRASKATAAVTGAITFTAIPSRSAQAIKAIAYNAKGQEEYLKLGNDTETTYTYDRQTFRLTALRTVRTVSPRGLQDLHYTYDPVGNISHIVDNAQQTVWHSNAQIDPQHGYVYDALYRLIEAKGRENTAPPKTNEGRWPQGSFPTIGNEPRNYTQRYQYDPVGNFITVRHEPDGGNGWTRHYAYAFDDQTQPASNRLWRTWQGSDSWDGTNVINKVTYHYDTHGSMLNLNRVERPRDPDDEWGLAIRWDWRDMIRSFDAIGGGIARYHYGIDKQRTRKHITRNPAVGSGTFTEDRIYLGGYELYRRRNPQGDVVEEIESLHLFEGEQRVLLVDDVISTDNARPDGLTVKQQTLFRYQYGNHLGSVGLELDHAAEIISYEEFHPYGTSAYRLMNSAVEAPTKPYRYTGMERDEESGLQYNNTRYFLVSLARWLSCDERADQHRYAYSSDSPLCFSDDDGKAPSNKTRFWGLLQGIGGMAQMIGGAVLAVNIEAPPVAVGGALLAAHGFDDLFSGIKKIMTGESEENATVQAANAMAKGFGMEKNNALALARAFDLVLGLISPTGPLSGGPKLAAGLVSGGRALESAVVKTGPTLIPPIVAMASASKLSDSSLANAPEPPPQLTTPQVAGKAWGRFFGLNKALDEKVALPTFTNLLERLSGTFLKENTKNATILDQVTLFTKDSKGGFVDTGRRVDFGILFQKADWLLEVTTRNQLSLALDKSAAGLQKLDQLEDFGNLVRNANHGGPSLFGRASGSKEFLQLRRPSLLIGEYPIFEAISAGLYDLEKLFLDIKQLPTTSTSAVR